MRKIKKTLSLSYPTSCQESQKTNPWETIKKHVFTQNRNTQYHFSTSSKPESFSTPRLSNQKQKVIPSPIYISI